LAASTSEPRRPVDRAPELADPYHGMDHAEANYYRAMHYLAGALWYVGAADEALETLNKLVADAMARSNKRSMGGVQRA
jgi:hypothetical protein